MTAAIDTENKAHHSNIDRAASIITSSCGWSAAAALIPVPFIDLAALAAVQGSMINEIAKLYGEAFSKDAVKGVVSVLLGTLIPGTIGSGLKAAPGIGTIVGAITFSAFAAASTYAVGKVIVRHFEGGGTALSFDAKSVSDDLKKEFASANKKTS